MLIHQNSCQHNLDQTRFVFYVFGNDDMALLFFMSNLKSLVNPLTKWFMPTIFLSSSVIWVTC